MTDWFVGCTTQAEARALYRKLAMCHHPDRGGATADMQSITEQYRLWPNKPSSFYASPTHKPDMHSEGKRGFTSHRRPWTASEDAEVEAAATNNRNNGITEEVDYCKRLYHVAVKLGRTYSAVRKRAERIRARSYRRPA